MSVTRRGFAGILAMGSTAFARATGFIEHRILRRPHAWESPLIRKDGYEWRSVAIYVRHTTPLRVIVRRPGLESLVEVTVRPTASLGPYYVQSLVGLNAEKGVTVRLESAQPFEFHGLRSRFIIHSGRIARWRQDHQESLGASSDMGPTIVDETIGLVPL